MRREISVVRRHSAMRSRRRFLDGSLARSFSGRGNRLVAFLSNQPIRSA